jgi:hypothetical protein
VEVELVLGLKPLPQTHRLDWTKTDIKDSQRHPSPPGVMIGCAERPSPVDAPIDFHSVPGGGGGEVESGQNPCGYILLVSRVLYS